MSEHADLELIAAFREGLLDPADGDRIGRHLSGCGECARRQTALDQVVTALAAAPPPPLPPGLAQRLDAALTEEIAAAQAATGAAGAAAGKAAHGGTGTRRFLLAGRSRAPSAHARHGQAGRAPAGHARAAGRPGGHDRRGGRLLAIAMRPLVAAASLCLLAGGGYLVVNSLAHTSSSPSTAAGRSGTQEPAKSGAELSPRTRMLAPRGGAEAPESAVVHSNTSYQRGQLGVQAAAVASQYATVIPSPGKAGYATGQPFMASPGLADCLKRVAGTQAGLIVDMASYEGHPATVIIAPRRGATPGHVWVVGAGCPASASVVLASSSF